MKTRIILIGAKGFVGTGIANFLKDQDVEYLAIDKDNYTENIDAECDILINANGNSKKRLADTDPVQDFEMNAVSTLKSLCDFKYKKYIYISTIDVYADCSNPEKNHENVDIDTEKISNYGLSKYTSETLVKKYAKDWIIFRLGGMVGVELKKNSVYDIINLKKTFVHPESKYQYMNTYDVARIIYSLSESSKEIYNLCGDGVISLKEIFEYADVPVDEDLSKLNKETYHINTSKISSLVQIPKTKETIHKFIQNELSNM